METEEQRLERKQNDQHKFSSVWTVGVVKSVEKKKSVADQFAVKYKCERQHFTNFA